MIHKISKRKIKLFHGVEVDTKVIGVVDLVQGVVEVLEVVEAIEVEVEEMVTNIIFREIILNLIHPNHLTHQDRHPLHLKNYTRPDLPPHPKPHTLQDHPTCQNHLIHPDHPPHPNHLTRLSHPLHRNHR